MWPSPSAECRVPEPSGAGATDGSFPDPGRSGSSWRRARFPLNSVESRTLTAAVTDVGRRRSGNEDSFEVWSPEPGTDDPAADALVVVCDGMGGSNAGEVASHMAAQAVVREFTGHAGGDRGQVLTSAVETANTEVWDHSRTRPDLNGMGTTCTALAVKDGQVLVAHVGDSRAYLVRAHRATQLTTDHSLVAQLVARQQLTAEEARHDPRRNVVTRSVGVGPEVEVDLVTVGEALQHGDTVVLCSDGLHGQVSDDEIAGAAMGESLELACRELVELANDRGGPDNITVAMLRYEQRGGAPPSLWDRLRRMLLGSGKA